MGRLVLTPVPAKDRKKRNLPRGWPQGGVTDRNGWAWCAIHDDCHVSLTGNHVKRDYHPCTKHKKCCVKSYVGGPHIPWPPRAKRRIIIQIITAGQQAM